MAKTGMSKFMDFLKLSDPDDDFEDDEECEDSCDDHCCCNHKK